VFTGLVEAKGEIRRIERLSSSAELTVAIPFARELQIGESVAIDGCCLTVVESADGAARFQVGPETLNRTTLGKRLAGDAVNLERALRADQRLGGHFVQGHVDGVAEVVERKTVDEWEFVRFAAGPMMREIVPKGSVAVDGVSLTVVDATGDEFSVMLIPHTLRETTLGSRPVGSHVNIETDVLAKYLWKMTRSFAPTTAAT
jgi:riboflavin synthase